MREHDETQVHQCCCGVGHAKMSGSIAEAMTNERAETEAVYGWVSSSGVVRWPPDGSYRTAREGALRSGADECRRQGAGTLKTLVVQLVEAWVSEETRDVTTRPATPDERPGPTLLTR